MTGNLPADVVADEAPDLDGAPEAVAAEPTGRETAQPVAAKAAKTQPEVEPTQDATDDADDVADDVTDDPLEAALRKAEKGDEGEPEQQGRERNPDGTWKAKTPTAEILPPQADEARAARMERWPAEYREAYAKLTPEARAIADAHEQVVTQGMLSVFQPAMQEAAPYMDVLTSPRVAEYLDRVATEEGVSAPEIVANVLGFERVMRYGTLQQKMQAHAKLIQDYGLPMPGQEPQGGQEQQPNTQGWSQQAIAQLHDMQRQLADSKWQLQRMQQAQAKQADTVTATEIQKFASAKDGNGQPSYPMFDLVRGAMADLIDSGKAKTLPDAYKMAVQPFEAEFAKRAKANEAARKKSAEAVAKAERMKPVRGSMPMGPASRDMDLDTIIGDAWNKLAS